MQQRICTPQKTDRKRALVGMSPKKHAKTLQTRISPTEHNLLATFNISGDIPLSSSPSAVKFLEPAYIPPR